MINKKLQITMDKLQTIYNQKNKKPYDLEERTLMFAKDVIRFCKKLDSDVINVRLIGQVIRSAGSVGANYREANEALSKKDFVHRIRITRKEAKESSYWLMLLRRLILKWERILIFCTGRLVNCEIFFLQFWKKL